LFPLFVTGVVDTSGKFTTGVIDKVAICPWYQRHQCYHGKYTASVVELKLVAFFTVYVLWTLPYVAHHHAEYGVVLN
jgi:hypothetical protein